MTKRKERTRAQVSMEYILITAFSLLVVMPLIVLFFQYSQTYNDDITANQANKIMDELLNAAQTIHYLGEPSQKTLSLYFPNNIDQITFADGYFSMKIDSGSHEYDLYRAAAINFTGNLSTSYGVHVIRVRAVNNTINIRAASAE
jgi:uncharacterized protein (UPF0333 family)